jgi:hypothetical protein
MAARTFHSLYGEALQFSEQVLIVNTHHGVHEVLYTFSREGYTSEGKIS